MQGSHRLSSLGKEVEGISNSTWGILCWLSNLNRQFSINRKWILEARLANIKVGPGRAMALIFALLMIAVFEASLVLLLTCQLCSKNPTLKHLLCECQPVTSHRFDAARVVGIP